MRIDTERLWARLNLIGHIGSDNKGGVSRFAWTPEYKEAVNLLKTWILQAGLTFRVDTVGNVFARLEGEDQLPAVLTGSHFDTVPCGGIFDGMAGVMGALEAMVSIKGSGIKHKRPIEMVAFVNEEASQFLGGTFGSKAMCGMLPSDFACHSRHRQTGQLLRDAMLEYGMNLNPDDFNGSIIDPENYYAFYELHIEQGRTLLDDDLPFAIVTAIAGIKQFYITLDGVAAHAGGMAMKDRKDAMAAAAAIACEVERLALNSGSATRGTVGFIQAKPGEHNIIAEKCVVPVDFREDVQETWERLYSNLMDFVADQCGKRGLTYSVQTTIDSEPARCDKALIDLLEEQAVKQGVPHKQMISYPAHDALNMARILPIGMIFLRSANDGVSHCPEEFTSKNDLAAGVELLASALLETAQRDLFL